MENQYSEWHEKVKAQGAKLYKETTVYADGQTYPNVVYALGPYRKFIGSWSPKQGQGNVVTVSPNWSAKGREFEEIK